MQRSVEDLYQTLVFGVKHYAMKAGFTKGLVGLSGGADSALVATIGADAFGPDNFVGVLMPSPYSTERSLNDAYAVAHHLNIDTCTLPITQCYEAYGKSLQKKIGWIEPGTLNGDYTEENIQARIRGTLLYALSNRLNYMVLNTGNRSENLVGYYTLYGDSVGALGVLQYVYKTIVLRLLQYIQSTRGIIPENIITKAPSAELRLGQRDDQTFPPYDILDPLLQSYFDKGKTIDELINSGYDAATVHRVIQMNKQSEYKRRQSPPGIRILR